MTLVKKTTTNSFDEYYNKGMHNIAQTMFLIDYITEDTCQREYQPHAGLHEVDIATVSRKLRQVL